MSEEQGESVGTPDDEPGDGTDDASEEPGARRETAADEDEEPSIEFEELVDLVDAHETEAVARELAGLRERVHALERELDEERAEREDLESRLKHKQAEFQNYKKRQSRRREQERARATEDLVERLLEVRDNLARALEQDDDADIREGVEATFRQLDDVLRGENVDPIEPEPGAEVDPQRHEVLLKVDGDQPAGTVEEVHRPGYEMADKVLRTARVTVADGDASSVDAEAESETDPAPGTGTETVDGDGGSAASPDSTHDAEDEESAEESAGEAVADATDGDAGSADPDGDVDSDAADGDADNDDVEDGEE